MIHTLTSSESLHLSALWRQYDDATEPATRLQLQRIISLYITAATYRRITYDLQTFRNERNKR